MELLLYKLLRKIYFMLGRAHDCYNKQFCLAGEKAKFYHSSKVINVTGKKENIRVGQNCHIYGELLIQSYGGRIVIGDDCFVGQGTRIWSEKEIRIGNHVLISHNVDIHDSNDHPLDSTERHQQFINIVEKGEQSGFDIKRGAVLIEDDVWIGFGSCIMKGVTIGKGAVIAAHSIVTKDVPAYTVMGNPTADILKRELS
ncbi:acyltransferase [Selenomonas sp. TAMA-11512]|uniref:acyltransferase n=1 Tax=Selenomonas sp. TAMA-11512 TaxID=3095337 RepID=UPI00308F13C8|nr:acyltransferase [Selenomonas sp. TAMA-11512]